MKGQQDVGTAPVRGVGEDRTAVVCVLGKQTKSGLNWIHAVSAGLMITFGLGCGSNLGYYQRPDDQTVTATISPLPPEAAPQHRGAAIGFVLSRDSSAEGLNELQAACLDLASFVKFAALEPVGSANLATTFWPVEAELEFPVQSQDGSGPDAEASCSLLSARYDFDRARRLASRLDLPATGGPFIIAVAEWSLEGRGCTAEQRCGLYFDLGGFGRDDIRREALEVYSSYIVKSEHEWNTLAGRWERARVQIVSLIEDGLSEHLGELAIGVLTRIK